MERGAHAARVPRRHRLHLRVGASGLRGQAPQRVRARTAARVTCRVQQAARLLLLQYCRHCGQDAQEEPRPRAHPYR